MNTKHTELVSVLADPATGIPVLGENGLDQPVPTEQEGSATYGAVYPGGASIPRFPLLFPNETPGASISADGSTVAWMGQRVGAQARTLPLDPARAADYSEPLWRRIADGPGAATRRVTGGSDPSSPGCVESGEVQLSAERTLADPCQGPFDTRFLAGGEEGVWTLSPADEYLPKLSSDGRTVAFLSNAHEIASGERANVEEASDDVYVAGMEEGRTRVQALRRLTHIAGGAFGEVSRSAPITGFDISPDGSQVAFVTQRTTFPLSSPAFVSVPAAVPGESELFDADLANQTLTRVTHGYSGETVQPEQPHVEVEAGRDPYTEQQGSFAPSFSADGNILAFSSTASNLAYGDGNSPKANENSIRFDGADAFVVSRRQFTGSAPETYVSADPPVPIPEIPWAVSLTATPRTDGTIDVQIAVPAAGSVSVQARGSVLVPAGGSHARGAKRRRLVVVTRTVAGARANSAAAGNIDVRLRLAAPYRPLAAAAGGLPVTLRIQFTGPGGPPIRDSAEVTFASSVHASRKHRSKSAVRHARTRGAKR